MNATATPEGSHPGALTLRHLHAREAVPAGVAQHVEACAECRARLEAFAREQREFEAEVPFERFAAGVERAARTPRSETPPPAARWVRPLFALASTVLVAVGVTVASREAGGGNRLKGGAGVEVVVAGAGGQRAASSDAATPEALSAGERVRVGVTPGPWTQVLVLSVDEQGAVSPVYERDGRSIPLTGGGAVAWLPDSLEFTGKGLERLVVLLADEPLTVDVASARVHDALLRAGGDVTRLPRIDVPGEQFHRSFLKP